VQVIVRDRHDRGARVVYWVPAAAADCPRPATKLAGLERQIVAAVGDEFKPAKVIARRLGRKLDSHFYRALRSLCRRDPPVLVRGQGGYRRP
jgi:hypothetical protein